MSSSNGRGDLFPPELQHDRPQLEEGMESEAMVHTPDPPVAPQETVARLPVGIVGQHIEDGESQEFLGIISYEVRSR